MPDRRLSGEWQRTPWAVLTALGVGTAALLLTSATLPRLLLLALLIAVSGRAVLLALLGPQAETRIGPGAPAWGFVGVAFGGSMVLACAMLLRLTGLYSYPASVLALAIAAAAACLSPVVRRNLLTPPPASRSLIIVWAVYVLVAGSLLAADDYPLLKSSAVYLTQGFDLFLDKDPSAWPYFGEMFTMPMMYVTHTVGALFALFSHGDHFDYYVNGQYWTNILLTPLVPIGAFLFFRRYLPWWAAIAAALGFCWTVLSWKLWSIRGETLG
jgi:hypothetical protein